jgi:hypothetical protein
MRTTITTVLLGLFVGTLAWSSTRIYAGYCVPAGFHGWIQSFVTSSSAPCQAILTLVTNSHTLYSTMIGAIVLGFFSAVKDLADSLLYKEKDKF